MANACCEHESRVSSTELVQRVVETETPSSETNVNDESFYPEADDVWARMTESDPIVTESNSLSQTVMKKKKKKKNQVLLEGYVELANDSSNSCEDDLKRAKSLTDDDLDELKGCLDLGFGFSYDEIPELCNTLPALELCYSMSQKFLDEHTKSPDRSSSPDVPEAATPIANWKISSPGITFLQLFRSVCGHQFLFNDGLKGAIVSVMRAFLRAFTNYFQTSAFAEINYPHYAGIEKEPGENFDGRGEAGEAVQYMPV